MVRLVPSILCTAASVIASVILLYVKMQSVSMHVNWMVVNSIYVILLLSCSRSETHFAQIFFHCHMCFVRM